MGGNLWVVRVSEETDIDPAEEEDGCQEGDEADDLD
jgi:hypothetical protein